MAKVSCDLAPLYFFCFQNVRVSAVFPQLSNKTAVHVFTPSRKVGQSSVLDVQGSFRVRIRTRIMHRYEFKLHTRLLTS